MSKEIAIQIEDLSKKYFIGSKQDTLRGTISSLFNRNRKEEFWALQDLNLIVKRGESIGLIGRNGAGKSTLLKILSKITPPTRGKVILNGRVASLLEVGTGFHPELTGRENIYLNGSLLGMTRIEVTKKLDEIIDFSGIEMFVDTPIKHYSTGMYMRLAFSVAAHLDTEILLVDEVLAVGDEEFQAKCLGKMNQFSSVQGRTVIFVSHNITQIKKLCSRTILLNRGKITMDGESEYVCDKYIGKETLRKTQFFEKYLEKIEVNTVDNLEIRVHYNLKGHKFIIPDFGFIVHDSHGKDFFGTNSTLEKIKPTQFSDIGKIIVNVKTPILVKGSYTMSVWFNDGKNNLIYEPHALSFEIGIKNGFAANGTIKPEVTYSFS